MSRDLAISLYAERGFVVSPRADYAAYLDYGRGARAPPTWWSTSASCACCVRIWRFCWTTQTPPPELEPVFAAATNDGRTLVYRIKD